MKLWPMKAAITCTKMMMVTEAATGKLVRVVNANAPEVVFTANQPIPATKVEVPAGKMLPRKPNAERLITICGTPWRGPQLLNQP